MNAFWINEKNLFLMKATAYLQGNHREYTGSQILQELSQGFHQNLRGNLYVSFRVFFEWLYPALYHSLLY